MKTYEKITITTSDDYKLQGRFYCGARDVKDTILIAGATGVPQRYYSRFCKEMTQQGYNLVTFDYRGIADSKYGSLKGFEASVLDWAEKDFAAALRYTISELGAPLVVGHSLGGHVYGLVPEVNETLGLVTFGTGAGWHGWMPGFEKYKVWFLWNMLAPVLSRVYGYLPSSLIGIGEDLPYQAYKQWKHWCKFPHYWFDDPDYDFETQFSLVTRPVMGINSTDDLWAPPASAKAFLKHYRNADLKIPDTKPKDWGVSKIGHMGYFHSKCLDMTTTVVHQFFQKILEEKPLK